MLIQNARDDRVWTPRIEEAIITLPDLRNEVIAMLSENGRLTGPWHLLWHDQHFCMISSEYHSGMPATIPFSPRILVQAIALAAQNAGHINRANQLLRALGSLQYGGGHYNMAEGTI